jgi:hypothetical protein
MKAMADDPRFKAAIERFDALNARDPDGKELVYSQRMTQWLDRLSPEASIALKMAARAQHLMRWQIPRSSFPDGRAGYIRWRTKLYDFHADKAAEVLRDVGYDDATIAQVRSLIRKESLKQSPDMQMLEDVICLVFLENYFADFAKDHDEEKLIRILRKTWKKMSPRGHEAAMTIQLGEREKQLIVKALASGPGE